MICECNSSLGNTGLAGCIPVFRVAKGIFAVRTYDDAGALNSITVADTIDDAYLTARLNDTDPSQRWYPIMNLENVTSERGDPTYETAPSNRKAFVQDGIRSFSAEIWGQGPDLKKKLDTLRCSEMSIFIVDKDGSIRGIVDKDSDTLLYPIKTDKNSWNIKLVPATDTTNEKLIVTFDWDQNEDDALLRMIAAGDMTADMLRAMGLLDINVTVGAITTTTAVITLTTDYGSLKDKVVDSGLVVSDFVSYNDNTTSKIYDSTGAANLTLSSVVESPNGTYTLTWTPAQTTADILKLKIIKNGRDYTNVNGTSIVIP